MDLAAIEMREFGREREFGMRDFERKILDYKEMRERQRVFIEGWKLDSKKNVER